MQPGNQLLNEEYRRKTMSKLTRKLINRVEASLETAGAEKKALFSVNNHLVLVVDDGGHKGAIDPKIVESIKDCANRNKTQLQTVRCSSGTGCVDLKTMDSAAAIIEVTEIKSQVERCLKDLAGVTVTGVFFIGGELVLVVDDGGQIPIIDSQIIAKIAACPVLSNAPLRKVRCSQGTGCVDLRE
jgi:hypothetical protein